MFRTRKAPLPEAPALPNNICQQIANRWCTASQHHDQTLAAKELGLRGKPLATWQTSGDYGFPWSSAVHELLEVATQAPQTHLHTVALALCEEHALGTQRASELVQTKEQ